MKFSIDSKILNDFPDTVEYIILASGLNNESEYSKEILDVSRKAEVALREKLSDIDWESLPHYKYHIDKYNQIQKSAGHTDSMFDPAHVALTKRVLAGKELPNINPLVNLYNSYSIKYGLPIGAEDLSKVVGDISLDYATGNEPFLAIGKGEIEYPVKGEVVWRDAHSVTCRMWGWRQCERTAITRDSKDVYIIVDFDKAMSKGNDVDIEQVIDLLANDLGKYLRASVSVYRLDSVKPSIVFDYDQGESLKLFNIENPLEDLKRLAKHETQMIKGSKGIRKRKAESMGLVMDHSFLKDLDSRLSVHVSKRQLVSEIYLQYSSDSKLGDLSSTVALRLAKDLRKPPREIATLIAEVVKQSCSECMSDVEVAPNGFINFKISDRWLINKAEEAVGNFDAFSASDAGGGRSMLVESPSANPNKPLHIGHLMNLFLGTSLLRMFEKVGFEGHQDTIVNDRGMPIVKTIWALQNIANGATPESEGLKPDQFIGKYYVLGSQHYKENPDVKSEVREMLIAWEAGDKGIRETWRKMIDWVLEGQLKTAARVWEDFGHLWYESEIYSEGRETIMKYLDGERVEQLEGGAIVGRIEEKYGVPDVVLLKSDGTSLYHTQDIHLTTLKIKKFNPWKAIWVVGNEQITHFQRLFSLLDLLELIPIDNLYHYAYGFVYGKDGKKMSSRDGQALSGDGLLDLMHEAALNAIRDRNVQSATDMDEDQVAEVVAVNALKFAFLVTDPFKDMKFDVDNAVAFTGRSGPYVMYAYARAKSILRAQDYKQRPIEYMEGIITELDHQLLIKCMEYQEKLIAATNNFAPSIVAEYIYELAKMFNHFYESESIQNASDGEKQLRLLIVDLTSQVLGDGMKLLGMRPLEQM